MPRRPRKRAPAGSVASTPQEFAHSLREEIAKWAKVVKAAGLAVQ